MLRKIIVLLGLLLIVLAGLSVYIRVHRQMSAMSIDTGNTIAPPASGPSSADPAGSTAAASPDDRKSETTSVKPKRQDLYILAVGIDTRGKEFTLNTDSLLVAHIIPQTHTVKLLSIPRDTRVSTHPDAVGADDTYSKINAVFAHGYEQAYLQAKNDPSLLNGKLVDLNGYRIPEEYISSGLQALKQSTDDLLGIDIDYTVLVNFQSVVQLVDQVGGITVDVKRSMYYDDSSDGTHIHLEPGVQHLDGQQALNYARFREDSRGVEYYSNDFDRGQRQQEVIRAVMDKLQGWQSLSKALSLLDIATANIKTDMSMSTMVGLVRSFYGHLDKQSIHSLSFDGDWQSPYVIISDDKLDALRQELQSTDEASIAQSDHSVNAADVPAAG